MAKSKETKKKQEEPLSSSDSDSDSSSSDSSSSDSSSSSSESSVPQKKTTKKIIPSKTQKAKESSSDSSSSDSDSSSSESDSSSSDSSSSSSESDVKPKKKSKEQEKPKPTPAPETKAAENLKRPKESTSAPAPAPSPSGSPVPSEVCIRKLPESATDDQIKDYLSQFGEIIAFNHPAKDGYPKPICFATFSTREAADAAAATSETMFMGSPMCIELSRKTLEGTAGPKSFGGGAAGATNPPSTTLFVANLSFQSTADSLWAAFTSFNPTDARVVSDRETGRAKGFGYVEFGSVEDAQKAFEGMTGGEVDGRQIRLDYGQPKGGAGGARKSFGAGGGGGGGGGRPTNPPAQNLFVGRLSYNTTNESLWAAFEKFNPADCRVMTDRETGQSKGFGYVDFSSVEDATKAFEAMGGAEIDGRAINLDYSQPKTPGGGGRGGGRGGFGGGRGGFGGGGRGGGRGGFGGGRGGRGGRGGFGGPPPRAEGSGERMTFDDE